jgi:hypothetical protein
MIRFDAATRVKLYSALKGAFPDSRPSDPDLVALSVCLDRARAQGEALPSELQAIDLKPYAAELKASAQALDLASVETTTAPRTSLDKARYYWVESKHSRLSPGGFDPFVGELAMVRVTLPKDRGKTFNTAIGKILPADHLIDTVLEANQKYARFLEAPLGRVDLITPPRQGVRFGAISILLGYKTPRAARPFCYILEAGTATGQPKVLYLGKTMDATINAYSGYQPTAFSCPSHAYTGKLTLNGDDPKLLTIRARAIDDGKSQPAYIQIDASFLAQSGDIKTIWPGFLIARAASIVFARQHAGTIQTECDTAPPGASS